MSLLCMGLYIDKADATPHCLENGLVLLGFVPEDNKDEIQEFFEAVPVGTLIAVKSFNPRIGLTIKAIGVVSDNRLYTSLFNGVPRRARRVTFLWSGSENLGYIKDTWANARNSTLYWEMNRSVTEKIVSLIQKK